jgi:hypothetical protein
MPSEPTWDAAGDALSKKTLIMLRHQPLDHMRDRRWWVNPCEMLWSGLLEWIRKDTRWSNVTEKDLYTAMKGSDAIRCEERKLPGQRYPYAVRAISGMSRYFVPWHMRNALLIPIGAVGYLWHYTEQEHVEQIRQEGLLVGGPDRKRVELHFSICPPGRKYDRIPPPDANGIVHTPYRYGVRMTACVIISVEIAEYYGCRFYQLRNHVVLAADDIPRHAICRIENTEGPYRAGKLNIRSTDDAYVETKMRGQPVQHPPVVLLLAKTPLLSPHRRRRMRSRK